MKQGIFTEVFSSEYRPSLNAVGRSKTFSVGIGKRGSGAIFRVSGPATRSGEREVDRQAMALIDHLSNQHSPSPIECHLRSGYGVKLRVTEKGMNEGYLP